jgi:Protein phosphatase 2C
VTTAPVPPESPAESSDQPARKPAWLVLTASERGASHLATQAPNQDSVATEWVGGSGTVAAVADGHGHSRHLRSARGSHFAVRVGCEIAHELAERLDASSILFPQHGPPPTQEAAADEITEQVREFLIPQVVSRWRTMVLADVAADPFTEAEQDQRLYGDDETIAYGSTLLLGVALHDWLILAQIGDGDVVGVRADGRAIMPVPADPQLDGRVTTSLCGPDALSDFRVGLVDTSRISLLAVMLATDGYGNAQVADKWPSAFSGDLAWMLREKDLDWLASQLPLWAARCASAHGSADDTTVALMLFPAALPPRPAQPSNGPGGRDPGSEETTIPAVPHGDTAPHADTAPHGDTAPHADTVPSGQIPAGQSPIEPVTVRQSSAPPGPGDTVVVPPGDADPAASVVSEPGDAGPDTAGSGPAGEDMSGESVSGEANSPDEQATAHWEPPPHSGADYR